MPVYEYECKDCEKIFEVQQKMSDSPLAQCPECNGEVKKLMSMTSFQLKGGGWYADGYSSPSNGKAKEEKPVPACAANKSESCAGCPAAASN